MVRRCASEASQRELQGLIAARDAAATELATLRRQLDESRLAHETFLTTWQGKLDESKQQLFETRLSLTNKTSECLRLDLALQEAEQRRQSATMDAECAQRKLDILKEEFFDLKAQHKDEVLELRAAANAREEQLALFREMEQEAELFLTHLAQHDDGGSPEHHQLLATIPSARRTSHAITVTKRALALQNQLDLSRQELGAAQRRAAKLEEDLAMARAALAESHSPYAVLEARVGQKDDELRRLRTEIAALRAENEALAERGALLEKDVRTLAKQRGELERVRAMLAHLDAKQFAAGGGGGFGGAPAATKALIAPSPAAARTAPAATSGIVVAAGAGTAAASPPRAAASLPHVASPLFRDGAAFSPGAVEIM